MPEVLFRRAPVAMLRIMRVCVSYRQPHG